MTDPIVEYLTGTLDFLKTHQQLAFMLSFRSLRREILKIE